MAAKHGQKCFHIHTNDVVHAYDKNCYFSWIRVAVVNGGTSWVLTLQDRFEDPPGTPVPNILLCGSWATNEKDQALVFWQAPEPVLMKGGIDIVPVGTPGDIYVWLFGWAQIPDT